MCVWGALHRVGKAKYHRTAALRECWGGRASGSGMLGMYRGAGFWLGAGGRSHGVLIVESKDYRGVIRD